MYFDSTVGQPLNNLIHLNIIHMGIYYWEITSKIINNCERAHYHLINTGCIMDIERNEIVISDKFQYDLTRNYILIKYYKS